VRQIHFCFDTTPLLQKTYLSDDFAASIVLRLRISHYKTLAVAEFKMILSVVMADILPRVGDSSTNWIHSSWSTEVRQHRQNHVLDPLDRTAGSHHTEEEWG